MIIHGYKPKPLIDPQILEDVAVWITCLAVILILTGVI
jgi:hypothetical protein